jgi:hypothetical protein
MLNRLLLNLCCGPVIRCFFDPLIRCPGWVKKWIRIRDEQTGSYFLKLRNQIFGLKYLNYLMRIRDPGLKKLLFMRPFGFFSQA